MFCGAGVGSASSLHVRNGSLAPSRSQLRRSGDSAGRQPEIVMLSTASCDWTAQLRGLVGRPGLLRRLFLGIISTWSGCRRRTWDSICHRWARVHVAACPGYSQSKVRDEPSAVHCGIARKTEDSVRRDRRKRSLAESIPHALAQTTLRGDRIGRATGNWSEAGSSPVLLKRRVRLP